MSELEKRLNTNNNYLNNLSGAVSSTCREFTALRATNESHFSKGPVWIGAFHQSMIQAKKI